MQLQHDARDAEPVLDFAAHDDRGEGTTVEQAGWQARQGPMLPVMRKGMARSLSGKRRAFGADLAKPSIKLPRPAGPERETPGQGCAR